MTQDEVEDLSPEELEAMADAQECREVDDYQQEQVE
jgi:hypothetical protein